MEASLVEFFGALLKREYFWVVILGLMLGVAELIGRYRDSPTEVFRSLYAWIYVAINGLLGAAALFVIRETGLSFENSQTSTTATHIYNVLFAGFGGAAFFRSSVVKGKVGENDVSIGPAFVIDTLLRVIDREVDRSRARTRSRKIMDMMDSVTLEHASDIVIPFCVELMQNVTASEQLELSDSVLAVGSRTDVHSKAKPYILGLRLVNLVGFGVLDAAVASLKTRKLIVEPPQQAKLSGRVSQIIRDAQSKRQQSYGMNVGNDQGRNGNAASSAKDASFEGDNKSGVSDSKG